MAYTTRRAPESGAQWFGRLGRAIVRHPWYPIVFWIVLLLVAVPFLSRVGSVTSNSATDLPTSSPSAVAQAHIDAAFPNQSAASESILLFSGPNVLASAGARAVVRLEQNLTDDPRLTDVGGVSTLFDAYRSYLAGHVVLGVGLLRTGGGTVRSSVLNASAGLWSPIAGFVTDWRALVAANGSDPAAQNPVAYHEESRSGLTATESAELTAFYDGAPGSSSGFNGSADCASAPRSVVACADAATRANVGPLLPTWFGSGTELAVTTLALSTLGVENYSAPENASFAASVLFAPTAGLPPGFLDELWREFPTLSVSLGQASAFASTEVNTSAPAAYLLPVPPSLRSQFVSADGSAEVILVTYTVGTGYTDPQGGSPVAADISELDAVSSRVLAANGLSGPFTIVQTGSGPLDVEENTVLTSSLAIVLPLTIIVLIGITMLYFRTPVAPSLTFAGLGIALGLGLGGVVLIGTFVTHVDVSAIELQETFVLGIGTDYSIFIVSRFREELARGRPTPEAVETAVRWAGQSVATSGTTAIIATLALTFSGVALLAQWGMVLSLSILMTVLLSLTFVPAVMTLLGPRAFWPTRPGGRPAGPPTAAAPSPAPRGYFPRVARFTQRRPVGILAVLAAVSIPLVLLALQVPLSYDFYSQLPGGHAASDGLTQLEGRFGGGYPFPIQTLVGFSSPLQVGGLPNLTEIGGLAELTDRFAATPGVGSVQSPVGGAGAPWGAWMNFSILPAATQADLRASLSASTGADGRSVLVSVISTSSGLSNAAVSLLAQLQGEYSQVAAGQPSMTSADFGGGAAVTHDLEQQTSLATQRMILAVAIGLIVVLFFVLRSWVIPLLAVGTIGLSLAWAWSVTDVVLRQLAGVPLYFFVPTILFIIILGLGVDYNIFLLTRVREERLSGAPASQAVVGAVTATGGIITAAAVILASAFAVLSLGQFVLLRAIGFSVAVAVLLDAMVVRTYLVPSGLQVLGERVWKLYPFQRTRGDPPESVPPTGDEPPAGP